jgi:hypothetical protein
MQVIYFFQKYCWVNGHAVTDDASYLGVENTRRDEMEPELAIRVHYGVTSIISTGKTDYYLRLFSQEIDYLSLPLITPLPSHNSNDGHLASFSLLVAPQVSQPLNYSDKNKDRQNT